MISTERWIARFSTELERRDISDSRIRDEVSVVRGHLHEDDSDAEAVFGDPIAYAASLAAVKDADIAPRSAVLSIFASIASFIVFVIAAVRWIKGDPAAAPWSIAGGLALLISVAVLSISLTRQAIASALRDDLTEQSDSGWAVSSMLLLLVPWAFIGFAGLVLALAALA